MIGIFLKEPLAGKVKTRLAAEGISPQRCADLYRAFLEDTLDLVRSIAAGRKIAAVAPPASPEFLASLSKAGFAVTEQRGENLGERMAHFFKEAFEAGAKKVVLIGSDSPTLPASYLEEALEALEQNEVVLGPSGDGGYYLIGLTRLWPELFREVAWSRPEVLSQTLQKIAAAGREKALYLLSPWYDIDQKSDLEFLRFHLETLSSFKTNPFPKRTWELLKKG